jgi:hypothetical protein
MQKEKENDNSTDDSKMNAMSDTVKYGAGNEGESLAENDNKENEITPEEIELLNAAGEDSEERDLHKADLDVSDNDGEPLNEKASANAKSGSDLDVPGSDEDDADEKLGEEDEENNSYSQADTE